HSNAALDIAGPTSADGANIIQNAYVGDQNQQWTFQSAGNDYYGIISRYSGKAVDVEARSQANGGNILQWTYNSATNQQWSLTPVSGSPGSSITIRKTPPVSAVLTAPSTITIPDLRALGLPTPTMPSIKASTGVSAVATVATR